jgi:hypothetical protein
MVSCLTGLWLLVFLGDLLAALRCASFPAIWFSSYERIILEVLVPHPESVEERH